MVRRLILRTVALLIIAFLFYSCQESEQEKLVEVRFNVVADSIPSGDTIFVAGNHDKLGNWHPAAIALDPTPADSWDGKLYFSPGEQLEFKFTRGAWSKEALNAQGQVPGNSTLTVTADTILNITIPGWRDAVAIEHEPNITGNARFHDNMDAGAIPARNVVVWLPPGYDEAPDAHYPVLYMHDGQNVFDPFGTIHNKDWRVDEVADSLIRSGELRPIIVVAVDNSDNRSNEYSDTEAGHAYLHFLTKILKPFIDDNYRTLPTRENTAIMGSSMGGLISFLAAWYHPDVFHQAACLSPAFIYNENNAIKLVDDFGGPKPDIRIYMDNGELDLEARLQPGCDKMLASLENLGFNHGEDLLWFMDRGAPHDEGAWAGRVHIPLLFMFRN